MASSTQLGPPVPPRPPIRTLNDRLSLSPMYRLPLGMLLGFASGGLLGMAKGSQDAGFRFTAENAHRQPKTQTGWYLYHKSKNYNTIFGGVKEGFKQAWRYTFWVGMYFAMEEEARQIAGNRDCLSSMFAGLGTAGIFSAWNRFPLPTAARTAKLGAKAGFGFGLLQDAVSLVRGRRVGYVEFVKRVTLGSSEDGDGQGDEVAV
ncbi:uncharacterized protein MYCGRDRAFT_65284 [Zymoseptoria tritici IPO323]|uniref:Mitochondrial import inner membrane translocase subunit TIM22 n=1 Tax=Zymoseptoria tritici (strain CBS 115943 / IPO323) TaxID=336722 RepID=F9WXQ0_ZYMTI|nr:uncharacterized protein MYCGRDRAFT_65284 [Zymoseptoria tritici IPO323]EGP92619.1 hypothetical protein MYCGRDRAFT_65284 [Zymoseptoria tritici IPO323]